MEISTKSLVINSGRTLKAFLEQNGLYIDNESGIDGGQNCLYLRDKTSFNWKSRSGVRVNCKNAARMVVEQKTNLTADKNGAGDSIRDFSYIIDNEADLLSVIAALRTIEGNAAELFANSEQIPQSILLKRDDLKTGIELALRGVPVSIESENRDIIIKFQELFICGLSVENEGYRIYNVSSDWEKETNYYCEKSEEGTWQYYLETIDECIGETQRLVMFEAKKGTTTTQKQSIDYYELVKKCELNNPETYKDKEKVRLKLRALLEPLTEGTNLYFVNNNTDGKNALLEIWNREIQGRRIHMKVLSDGNIWLVFKLDEYNLLKNKVNLPDNMRANKYPTQPHVKVTLDKVWNVVCELTGNGRYSIN